MHVVEYIQSNLSLRPSVLNPQVDSPPFAAVLLLLQPIHFRVGRPGLPAWGFKRLPFQSPKSTFFTNSPVVRKCIFFPGLWVISQTGLTVFIIVSSLGVLFWIEWSSIVISDSEHEGEAEAETVESPPVVDAKKVKSTEKCRFFPNCKNGDACPYSHPTTTCM